MPAATAMLSYDQKTNYTLYSKQHNQKTLDAFNEIRRFFGTKFPWREVKGAARA